MTHAQKIIWPWNSAKWQDMRDKFVDSKIASIVDMDCKISSMYMKGIKISPRQISEMFNQYYSDDQYKEGRVPQDHFVNKILPFMQSLLGSAQKNFKGCNQYVLTSEVCTNVSFNRVQIATIITAMWFGLFNYQYVSKGPCKMADLPEPTFAHAWLNQNMFFLRCILNYFSRVYEYMSGDQEKRDLFEAGNVIFQRSKAVNNVEWLTSDKPLTEIAIGDGRSDDAPTKMIVGYASELIGGVELFKDGMTQECVILLTRPECLIATIICANLAEDSLTVMGVEKMSQYTGYGSSVGFLRDHRDTVKIGYSKDETEAMAQCSIIFIDASNRSAGRSQFIDDFERDLNKAYCGFSSVKFKSIQPIATANWSYKFQGANTQLKFIQMLLAASQASKSLYYYPFGRDFENQLIPFVEWLEGMKLTVGGLFGMYLSLLDELTTIKNPRFGDVDIFAHMMGQ